jgi:hypothetical protein
VGEGDGSSQRVRIQGEVANEPQVQSAEPDTPPSRRNEIFVTDYALISSHAGDQLEFASLSDEPAVWSDANFNNCPQGQGTCRDPNTSFPYPWYHIGPVVVHISRVPDGGDVHTYDGAGEWIKM